MTGVQLIVAERERQIDVEGWDAEHDDGHSDGELQKAARCYLSRRAGGYFIDHAPSSWPFGFDWWKPSDDPIRNLTKAGALIAAEIDRLQRKAAQNVE